MSDQDHPRTRLNNELQSIWGNDKAKHIRWETWYTGSPSSPVWHSTIYIDDMKYGDASAANKGAAMNEAARQAYDNLTRE
ncbi:hypothetical protein K503DRAFT_806575 [Rhizopogon vinicolor AM-OR11-026]|uniref:DRBM domain-containing protein n=1 Tax=Rhizopogon vinicolor AM-OR11-026 TaxID=1314800 RepID=A0A1B7ME82_9AGAM|nr:hypothetical protein K503DRAFT_806575 [Rhizopogon vinicolor AM-OR11-026]